MNVVERLRRPHYVYRLYDADMNLLYVGCTYAPRKRLREHKSAPWFGEVVVTRITAYPDALDAMRAEEEAHRVESPRHSTNGHAPIEWAERVMSA